VKPAVLVDQTATPILFFRPSSTPEILDAFIEKILERRRLAGERSS
jgi:hypothetical protein